MIEKAIGNPTTGAARPIESKIGSQGGVASKVGGLDFKRTLDGLTSTGLNPAGVNKAAATAMSSVSGAEKLKFSNHAIERMRSRGISFAPDEMKNIENAIGKAAAKGSKDTLVLSGDNALIVSVKNSTVVTVMDRQAMKDNVFTNIDSTVVI